MSKQQVTTESMPGEDAQQPVDTKDLVRSGRKGDYGYFAKARVKSLILSVIMFAVCITIYFIGIKTTGSNKNILTVAAIFGVLPASKSLTNFLIRMVYKPITEEVYHAFQPFEGRCLMLYNLVWTSSQKNIPVDCLAIRGNSVFGYSGQEKTDTDYAKKHAEAILKSNGITGVNIRIYKDRKPLLEWLDRQEADYQSTDREQQLAAVLLHISL